LARHLRPSEERQVARGKSGSYRTEGGLSNDNDYETFCFTTSQKKKNGHGSQGKKSVLFHRVFAPKDNFLQLNNMDSQLELFLFLTVTSTKGCFFFTKKRRKSGFCLS